tara:strand:+ start:480 stop:2858 length:2379 start_codon:yes stop_codon:yes gene_type:complete
VSNNIIVRFQPKGDKRLINSLEKLVALQKELAGATKKTASAFDGLGKNQKLINQRVSSNITGFNSLQSSVAMLRNKILLASFAFTAFSATILRFTNATGKANEIISKSNVVFGENADEVKEWADSYGNAVGRATTDILEFASSLQDTFVPLGFGRREAAALSQTLTRLAIDVASFNNASDAQVLEAFKSAVVGNHETVKRYGIIINEAALQKEALRSGLIKIKRPLTDYEKVLARVNLIQKGTTDAQGDAIRTSDSYVNKVKELNAAWTEFSQEIGEVLLPAVTVLVEKLTELLQSLDVNRVVGYSAAITGLGAAYLGARAGATFLTRAAKLLGRGLLGTSGLIGGTVLVLGELASWFFKNEEKTKSLKKEVKDIVPEIKSLTQELKDQGFSDYAAIIQETSRSYGDLQTGIKLVDNELKKLDPMTYDPLHEVTEEEIQNVIDIFDKEIEVKKNSALISKELGNSYDKLGNKEQILFNQIKEGNIEIDKNNKLVEIQNQFSEYNLALANKAINKENRINALIKMKADLQKKLNKLAEENDVKMALLFPKLKNEIEFLELKNKFSGDELFVQQELMKLKMKGMELNSEAADGEESELERFKRLIKVKKDLTDVEKIQLNWANKLSDALIRGGENNGKYAEAFKAMLEDMAKQLAAKAVVFSFLNILSGGTFAGGWGGKNFLNFVGGAGGGIFHQGGQVQGYATGGMIPMNSYHSGGGVDDVPIMAQEGEFVMRRSAVESIGVENLNRMNRTGQTSGGVNVTFSGNVVSDDFIEDVAIPKIKDAIRRGADIGIG